MTLHNFVCVKSSLVNQETAGINTDKCFLSEIPNLCPREWTAQGRSTAAIGSWVVLVLRKELRIEATEIYYTNIQYAFEMNWTRMLSI
jgi:hypothetical protein